MPSSDPFAPPPSPGASLTAVLFSPADEAVGVAVGSDIVVTFSGNIARGSGNITIKNAGGVVVATYDAATSGNLSISGNTLTLNPSADLAYGTGYKVEFASGTIKDLSGNNYTGTTDYNFTTTTLVNSAPTGTITITGTPTQGQTLTATNTLADLDGLGTIVYQWKAAGVAIDGATASTFTPTEALVGKTLAVTASYTDGHGTAESVTSPASATIANTNDSPTGSVTISGAPTQGQTLTLTNTLADLDGLGAFSYLWKANGVAIPGATQNSFTLSEAQVGKTITGAVSYTDGHGTAESVTSAASSVVANVNDAPTGSVTIAGTPNLGQVLTASNTIADVDGLGAISYQWIAGGVAISGATSSTFTLTQAQVGKTVSVAASYTDGHGTVESVNSGATGIVATVDLTGPVVSTFTPADEAKGVQVGANVTLTFNEPIQWGNGSVTLKDASGATVASYNAGASSNMSLSGNTLTVNPTKDFGIFTGYKVEIGAGAVKDLAGNSNLAVSDYNFTTATVDGLYHFFVVAFNAAPGFEYMTQLAEAWNYGYNLQKIVNVYTTKYQFTDVYPISMSNLDMATNLVANIVKNSASNQAKQEAIGDIKWCLDNGWTRGDVLFTVFGNLANKPLNDPTWGGTAQQFLNETAVARYYTEVMGAGGTDLATLRAVIGSVDNHTDVSTPELIATLIGVELAGMH